MKKIAAIGFALLMVFAVFVPVVSALNDPTKEGYQSVVNPNVLGERSPENIGHLDVLLACRAPQIGGEFTIVPVTVSAPFTNAARVDKAFVDQFVKQFGEPEKKQYLPDGTFDGNFAPGTYLLKQIDGNGGQPEFALVTIKAADAQTVVFLGHGISGITEKAKDIITVTEATYGMTKVVVDEPAHVHKLGNYEKDGCHYDYVGAGNGEYTREEVNDFEAGHVHARPTFGMSGHDFHYNGIKYQIVQNNEHYDAFVVTGHDTARKAEFVDYKYTFVGHVHHTAVTHVEGEYVDVKAEVQQALDNGAQTMKFRNDFPHKGIVTADDQPLVTVNDPAPGQVKAVHIVYTVNGGEPQTVDTMEYEVFTLA